MPCVILLPVTYSFWYIFPFVFPVDVIFPCAIRPFSNSFMRDSLTGAIPSKSDILYHTSGCIKFNIAFWFSKVFFVTFFRRFFSPLFFRRFFSLFFPVSFLISKSLDLILYLPPIWALPSLVLPKHLILSEILNLRYPHILPCGALSVFSGFLPLNSLLGISLLPSYNGNPLHECVKQRTKPFLIITNFL